MQVKRRNTWNYDIKGKPLYENDRILFNVRRVSESSSYGTFTTKKDGWYRITGKIEFWRGEFRIVADKDAEEKLAAASGSEQFNRGVWWDNELYDSFHNRSRIKKIRKGQKVAPMFLGRKHSPEGYTVKQVKPNTVKGRYDILKEENKV